MDGRHGKKSLVLVALAVAAALALTLWLFSYGRWQCLFYQLTGIPCAGCGMTTALVRLLQLDFAGAFAANPLIYILPGLVVAGAVLFLIKGSEPLKKAGFWAVPAGAFGAVWLVRIVQALGQ